MNRRVLALAAATATAVAILPATPALAAAAATANLVGSSAVYPGADKTFTIRVTNSEMPLLGKSINAIRVNLPVSEAGITLGSGAGSAAGFTEATATNLGTTQFLTYRGGSVRPGSSVDITFPTTVGAPLAKDLLGDFRVQVSSDNFQTASNAAGSLVAKVQVLEILQAGLRPATPTSADGAKGVTDRTGTAGQKLVYASEVRNHAQRQLTVAAGLTSSRDDSVSSASVPVPAGGTAVASIPVTLGAVTGARTLTATATAPSAEAPAKTDTFTSEAQAALTPASLDGTRVKSGEGSARDFTVSVAKSNAPAIDALTATLRFGTNSCGVVGSPTYARGGSTQQLTFRCGAISGVDGALPATVVYSVVSDDNLAGPYGDTKPVGSIIIDNVSPILDLVVGLPNDRDGDKQGAVKSGDAITVSGNIQNAGDLAANTVRVTLQPNAGDAVVINAPVSGSGETRTFSGSASPTWNAAATSFTSRVEAVDTADNTGAFQAPGATAIDLKAPTLLFPENRGTILEPSLIEVTYADATYVRGGCDSRMWLIDGRPGRVSAVRTGDSLPCESTNSDIRLLELSSPLGETDTPQVTYDPTAKRTVLGTRPAKDAAGNDGIRETIDTVTTLIPAAPSIIRVERRDSTTGGTAYEPAYFDADDQRYFTNTGGADAVRLTVGGIRNGYTVEVVEAGRVIASRKFTAAPSPLTQGAYEGDVLVPLGTVDAVQSLSVRLVSSVGNTGGSTPFAVELDRKLPGLGLASISGNTVTSAFTEKIVLGSDFADNWFVSETVATEDGTARRTVNADSVTADGLTSRKLQVTLLDATKFAGVDYFHQSGTRYEDRAGNQLASTLG